MRGSTMAGGAFMLVLGLEFFWSPVAIASFLSGNQFYWASELFVLGLVLSPLGAGLLAYGIAERPLQEEPLVEDEYQP